MKNMNLSSEKGKSGKKRSRKLLALIVALFLAFPILSQSVLQLRALSYVSHVVTLNATPAPGTKVETGMIIEYTLRVINPGISATENLYVRDYVPAGTHYVADSVSEYGSYVDGPNGVYLQWTIPELAGSEEIQLYFQVCVDESSADLELIENRALYETDFDPYSAMDPRVTTNYVLHPVVHPEPMEPLIQATLGSSPNPGESVWNSDITYRMQVTNYGPTMARSVVARCYIPEGAEYVEDSVSSSYKGIYRADRNYVQWIIYDIYPEEEAELSFTVHVEREDGHRIRCVGLFEENFDPEAEEDPRNLTNVVEHTTPIVCNIPSTIVTGETDPTEDVELRDGNMITYTVNVENINGGQGDYVRIRDYIPEGTLYMEGTATDGGQYAYDPQTNRPYVEWLLSDLPENGVRQVSFRAIVTPDAYELFSETIANQVLYEVTNDPDGTGDPRNSLPWTKHPVKDPYIVCPMNVVYLESDPVPGTKVMLGDVITYQLRAVNIGEVTSPNLVIRDTIPEGTAYVAGSATGDGVYIEKPIPPGSKDSYAPGELQWVIEDLGPMEERILTFQVRVCDDKNERIINVARYETNFDPLSSEEPPMRTNTTEHFVVSPHICCPPVVYLEADPVNGSVVREGDYIYYQLTTVNVNDIHVPYVRIRNYIPEGTSYVENSATGDFRFGEINGKAFIEWRVIDVPANGEESVRFAVRVDGNTEVLSKYNEDYVLVQNTAFYDWAVEMPHLAEENPQHVTNRTVHLLEILKDPVISVKLTADPAAYADVRTGDIITYKLQLQNDGGPASGVVVDDFIPRGTTYVPGSVTGKGDYIESMGRVRWVYDEFPAYTEETLSFQVRVEPSYDDGTNLIKNQAFYWEGGVDYFGPIQSTGPGFLVHKKADPIDINSIVAVYKSAVPANGTTLAPGDKITYQLTAKNIAEIDSPYIRVRDYIPQGTTYVDGSASNGGSYFKGEKGAYVEWIIPFIAVGSEKTCSFAVTVDKYPPKSIQNMGLYEAYPRYPVPPGGKQENLKDPMLSTNSTRHLWYPAVEKVDISKATVSNIRRSYVYNGSDIKPVPVVRYRGATLREGRDYELSYSGNRNAGTGQITITGIGNYKGRVTKNFTIMKKAFSASWVSGIEASYAYTGSRIQPEPVVSWGGTVLKNGRDYTITYSSNRNVGIATVWISGKGNYIGTVAKTFRIKSKPTPIITVKPGKWGVTVNWF